MGLARGSTHPTCHFRDGKFGFAETWGYSPRGFAGLTARNRDSTVRFLRFVRYSLAMSPTATKEPRRWHEATRAGRSGPALTTRRMWDDRSPGAGPGVGPGWPPGSRVPDRRPLPHEYSRALRDGRHRSSQARPGAAGPRRLAQAAGDRRPSRRAREGRSTPPEEPARGRRAAIGRVIRPDQAGRDVASGGASSKAEVRRSLVFFIPDSASLDGAPAIVDGSKDGMRC